MSFGSKLRQSLGGLLGLAGLLSFCSAQLAAQPAFRIDGQVVTVDQLYKDHQSKFYELEKQKYELIDSLARQQFLDKYWEDLAKKEKTSPEAARDAYLAKQSTVKDAEITDALGKFKDHPRLKEMSDAEKRSQVVEYLQSLKTRDVIEDILQEAINSKKLLVMYEKPQEPRFPLKLSKTDPVKYGPEPKDTKPMGCSGEGCPITVVEYSEFQCPFCERVLPTVRRLMAEYKGKAQWVVRDFPLGFHNRAKPAAVAAHCAKDQGKYWEMYEELFRNQRNLNDDDLKSYAKNIGLDLKKFNKCFDNPEAKLALIEENYRSGEEFGVTGTPAFFINGRRLSGALPYEEFKRIFDEELAQSKQKS
ncbi:MAG: DsbA family protein [Oligoflexus sp.]